MAQSINSSNIKAKASRGYVREYYGIGKKKALKPSQALHDLGELMYDDTFNYHVRKLVNSIFNNGSKIVERKAEHKRSFEKEEELKALNFEEWQEDIMTSLITYNNAFGEIEKNKKLHMLETTEMEINTTPHGEVIGYTQEVTNSEAKKKSIFFKPEQCVHFYVNKLGTNPWGFVNNRAIKHVVYQKNILNEYIFKLISEDKLKKFWKIKDMASSDQVYAFIDNLKNAKLNPDKDLIIEGDIDYDRMRETEEIQYLIELLNKYEDSIAKFLLVPPALGGEGDSGKGTGEFQVRYAYDDAVRGWQRFFLRTVNNKLFPLLGMEKFKMKFMPMDKLDDEKVLSNAIQLQALGYSKETINAYISNTGFALPVNAKIEDIEDESEIKGMQQNMNANSRKPSNMSMEGTQKTGQESGTRQEQIIGKSKVKNFNKYPYVI